MCRARRSSTSPSGVPSASTCSAGDVVDLAQQPDPEPRRGLLALAPPVAVAALGVVVRDARVDDEQRQPRRREVEGHLLAGAVAGVEEQRVPGRAEHRRGLVEDAGRRADEVVLRAAGELDEVGAAAARGRPGRAGPARPSRSARPTRTARRPRGRRCRPGCSRRRRSRSRSPSDDAGRVARPAVRGARATSVGRAPSSTTAPSPCSEANATRPSSRRPTAARVVCSIATGSTKPPL